MGKNSGPAAARNVGASHAQGDYLCFLDSDDQFLDGYFQEIVAIMESAPHMHAVKVGMEFYDPLKGYILPNYDPRYVSVIFSSPCNVMIRRKSFHLLGGFSEDPVFRGNHGGEDVAFCKALAEHLSPLGRIDKTYYRCWSCEGSHVDNFLATTRLADNPDGFEFVGMDEARKPGGTLDLAIRHYMDEVKARVACSPIVD
jgi:glycosyltransferase involved in cell wall biosynthesis